MKSKKSGRENVYKSARKAASLHDGRLASREMAASLLDVSLSTLTGYENGVTKVVPVDKVMLMADLYNAPELMTGYCKHECPIGRNYPFATEQRSIEGIALRLIREFNPEKLKQLQESLIEIAKDGDVTQEEEEDLEDIIENLDELSVVISELKLAGAKILKRRSK